MAVSLLGEADERVHLFDHLAVSGADEDRERRLESALAFAVPLLRALSSFRLNAHSFFPSMPACEVCFAPEVSASGHVMIRQ